MGIPKFAKPDILREAITSFKDGMMTTDQITAMHFAWPKESSLQDLAMMELGENEIWDRAENFMMNMMEPPSIYDRLSIWVFIIEYKDD